MGDTVADIDSVLAAGEPEPAVALCPHCEDEWHGLPITRRMRDMAFYGHVDADYRYADDGSEVPVSRRGRGRGDAAPARAVRLRPVLRAV